MTDLDLGALYGEQLAAIEKAQERLLDRCGMIMRANSPIYMPDFYVLGALKRGMALCAGFRELFKQNNYTCAATLLRLQVDTAARLYALEYVADKGEFTSQLIAGKKFSRLKDRDGNLLKDFWIIKKLAQIAPWVTGVYERTSDFVHLTGSHFFSTISNLDEEQSGPERTFQIVIGPGEPPQKPHVYEEILDAFLEASRTVERVALMYLEDRERGIASLPSNWQDLSRSR
ncbi:hypothetical protein PUR23_29670 [Methylorubrum populi]|uniref:hypothetical protein n=1 Tax=Methylorubrum populi TaxID=223967 RepID=UPI0031F94E92